MNFGFAYSRLEEVPSMDKTFWREHPKFSEYEDEACIEFAALVLLDKSRQEKKRISVYAASLLNECAKNGWPLPLGLADLVVELLLDADPIGSQLHCENSDPHFGVSAKLTERLQTELDKAFERVNVVGLQKYWAAVDYEASLSDDHSGLQPSTATVSAVAQKSGAARDTIRRWRKTPTYREQVKNRRTRNP